jgi:RNA polymerase sigma-70 factor, ECF subfamily
MTHNQEQIEQALTEYQLGKDPENNSRLIFKYSYDKVFRFFNKRGIRAEEGSELTQEVLLRVFRGMPTLQSVRAFDRWLFQIAENILDSYWRSQKAKKRDAETSSLDSRGEEEDKLVSLIEMIPDNSSNSDPLEAARAAERQRILSEAIMSLSPQRRRCVYLFYCRELSIKETANLMHLEEGTVQANLAQAREKMKEYLAAHGVRAFE